MSDESNITSLHVSLPDPQKAWVKDEATRTGCSTPSEYVRRLIHDAQKARARDELEEKLLAALDSGESEEVTPQEWAEIRAEVKRRIEERRSGRRGRFRAQG
jgi:Arc/MetJ-type ribon-helix-helix transcriptional regulator